MSEPSREPSFVKVTINGVEHDIPDGENLIKAAQDRGTYIPRFCWHERMKPVGMCRMCLVEIETPRGPMLVTACTQTVADGMVVDTENPTVDKAQEAILEFLLANHPLDCPVCDKGGECPLQDQALAYGPGESRFVEIKRTYEKPIPISDLVLLDRERCILCARCTRFSDEISGDPLIEFKDRGNQTEVNTFPDLPFSSYFSGNTVQICPVGALTAKPYRFRARPWDLRKVESSSLYDPAHPRIEIHSSQNEVVRHTGVDNDATNHGWLSDKDRFGFQYLGSEHRLTTPLVRREGELRPVEWHEALDIVAGRLRLILEEDGGEAIGIVGGANGTNEDAYALARFGREVLGTPHIDCRIDDTLDAQFLAATVDRARISDLDEADTILVWAPDLKEEHPTLYLRARRAAQELGKTLIVIHPRRTGLDDRASLKMEYRPGGGFELLHELEAGEHPYFTEALAGRVVALVGLASHADGPRLAEAVAAMTRRLSPGAKVLPLASRSNTFGALDMGLAPDLLPGRRPAERPGKDTREIMEALDTGGVRALILVGADPVQDMLDPRAAVRGIESAEYVVSIDLFLNDSNREADVIFPAAGFAEKEGLVTNVEGRVQKVNQIRPAPGSSRPDWAILDDLSTELGEPLGLVSTETIAKQIADDLPLYSGVTHDSLEWEHRDGVVVPLGAEGQVFEYVPVSLEGPAAPGAEFTLHVARVMYDNGVRIRHSPALHPLGPGPVAYLHPADAPGLGAREEVPVQLVTRHGEGTFSLRLDDGTPMGVVYVPFNQDGAAPLGSDPVVRLKVVT